MSNEIAVEPAMLNSKVFKENKNTLKERLYIKSIEYVGI